MRECSQIRIKEINEWLQRSDFTDKQRQLFYLRYDPTTLKKRLTIPEVSERLKFSTETYRYQFNEIRDILVELQGHS
jgi:hypothetical protein